MNPFRPQLNISTVLRFTALCALFLALFHWAGADFAGMDQDWELSLHPFVMSVICALTFMIPRPKATRCRGCGRKIPLTWTSPKDVLCPSCNSGKLAPAARRRAEARGCAIVGLLMLALAAMLSGPALQAILPGSHWVASLVAFPFIVLALAITIFVGLIARQLAGSWRMRRPARALAIARACADETGRTVEVGNVTVYAFGDSDILAAVEAQSRAARAHFERLVGESVAERPLRIFAFGTRSGFDAFFRRAFLYTTNVDGAYLTWPHPAAVVTTEFAAERLPDLDRLLRSLFGYFYLDTLKRCPTPMWLSFGVASMVASGGDAAERRRLNRKMLASIARGNDLGAAELFEVSPRSLVRIVRDWQDRSSFARYQQLTAQSWSVVEFLGGPGASEDRRARFRQFLSELGPGNPAGEVFNRHFGQGFDRLLDDWRTWVKGAGLGDQLPPPPHVRTLLEERVLPIVRNSAAPATQRIQAVRELGRTGYAFGADALIELLKYESGVSADEVLWSLESISGRVLGSDPHAWQEWWDGLPADVTSTALNEHPA